MAQDIIVAQGIMSIVHVGLEFWEVRKGHVGVLEHLFEVEVRVFA